MNWGPLQRLLNLLDKISVIGFWRTETFNGVFVRLYVEVKGDRYEHFHDDTRSILKYSKISVL